MATREDDALADATNVLTCLAKQATQIITGIAPLMQSLVKHEPYIMISLSGSKGLVGNVKCAEIMPENLLPNKDVTSDWAVNIADPNGIETSAVI